MAPTPSTEFSLSAADGRWLVARARSAIGARLGLAAADPGPAPGAALQRDAACFVTLTLAQQLRGCIGTLNATEPLCVAVAHYAECAAFDDPRFPPLTAAEWPRVALEVSVLSPPTPIDADSESALLAQLQPGRHGLIIAHGQQRATFLPQVWESLPRPAEFLRQLKRKAGLADDFPVAQLACAMYSVNFFHE